MVDHSVAPQISHAAHSLGFRDYVVRLTLLDTGIRVSELCGPTLESVHDVYLMFFGRERKEREVGISPTTAEFIWRCIHQHRTATDETVTALFTGVSGQPLRPYGVEKLVQRVKRAAGIEDAPVTPHKFRHARARAWLERGDEISSLSRLLGHSSVKTVEMKKVQQEWYPQLLAERKGGIHRLLEEKWAKAYKAGAPRGLLTCADVRCAA